MTSVTPTATGGPITGWAVSPSLPSGLSLDSSTGEISGTPDAVTSSAIYTITATNTGGSTTADVTIVVNDVAPSSLTYSPSSFTLTKGTAMTAVTPTATGGPITGWAVSPSLPSGLSLDSSTGEISGTPDTVTSSAIYTVTASNTVVARPLMSPSLSMTLHHRLFPTAQAFTLTKGTAMTAVTPTATGGPITGWSVSPSLPSGLSLDSSTGEISGTPDTVTSSAIYTVTASNTGGSTTADVTIVVNDVARHLFLQPKSSL